MPLTKRIDAAGFPYEICILAGGLSSRMGQDKSKLKLGGKTLLSRICSTARQLGRPVRVIRHDLVPRCGPLGGIYTALKTTQANAVLFLSCDMPLVTVELLRRLVSRIARGAIAAFVSDQRRAGFPFLLRTEVIGNVETLLARKQFSLNELARNLKANRIRPVNPEELLNLNTPQDWARAEQLWNKRLSRPAASRQRRR